MSYKYPRLPLDQFRASPLQPEIRTTESAIKRLLETVKASRYIVPIVVRKDDRPPYEILDGHRRWTVARVLGYEKIPFTFGAPGATFTNLNATTRTMKGFEWLTIWAKAHDKDVVLKHFPVGTAVQIRALIKLLGSREVERLGMEGRTSPNIFTVLEMICQLFRDHNLQYEKKDVALWLVNNQRGTQGRIRAISHKTGINVRRRFMVVVMKDIQEYIRMVNRS